MMRSILATILAVVAAPVLSAQNPEPKPPGTLPPSITGKPYEPVTPTAATTPKPAPIERFKGQGVSSEALVAVDACKEAAGWLSRLSKADGRFVPGIDPTLSRELSGSDVHQAMACLGLARLAKFTGDEKLAALASQCCLTLLTLAKPDAKDTTQRVPTIAADRGSKVAFAALLATSNCELPNPDAALLLDAEKLARFLYGRLRKDGSVQCGEAADGKDAIEDVGLVFQCLMATDRGTPAAWKSDALARAVAFYSEAFKTEKSSEFCAALLPGLCEYALKAKSEAATKFALELADELCERQYSATDAKKLGWVGAFKPATGDEPTIRTACGLQGLAAATLVAAQVPDAARFKKYRSTCSAAMGFLRTLQFGDGNAKHFERSFRQNYLLGGVFGSPSDGCPRADHAGLFAAGLLQYLETGIEKGD